MILDGLEFHLEETHHYKYDCVSKIVWKIDLELKPFPRAKFAYELLLINFWQLF